jgi:DNA-binding response OmpR family regulator
MQPAKIKVLLAEDDLVLGYVIKDNLEIGGYDVILCPDGDEALQQFQKQEFDICLLDVMMPAKDGFAVAKKIRLKSDVIPILFITSKALEEDKIKGFQSGADDYIVKPFNMQELILRMEVFLRRTKKLRSEESVSYQVGRLRFSFTDLKIYVDEQTINLTQKEADLLLFLCKHPNKILKREEVLLNVWGKDDYFLGRSMDVFITKLRKHFKADASIVLETIHGIGFRFNVPEVHELS